MQAILAAAAYLTERRRVPFIFFDGRTFSTQAQRDEVLVAAEHAGAQSRILHVSCADAVAERRLAAGDPEHPAQNRDPALYRTIKQHFEPIQSAKLEVDTTTGIDGVLDPVEAYLKGRGQGLR
jgi:predicted kinase